MNLTSNNEWVEVTIEDAGKGMPEELVAKILKRISVTVGKKSGHGIGLGQVHEILEQNQGELRIVSNPGVGTKMTVAFPRIKAPSWIADEIELGESDIVLILDDDTSIHGAWTAHFEPVLKKSPNIQLLHFQIGEEALSFLNGLPHDRKEKVFLLTDYELLKQDLNGLDVVERSQIHRSILVTSHYANADVQAQATKIGTKILPKQLASEIPIKIIPAKSYAVDENGLTRVDAVIVDDDERFVSNLLLFAFCNQDTHEYYDPDHFLKNINRYSKDTRIYLDNNFAMSSIKGMEIAKRLHEQGYQRLFILSGEVFKDEEIPNYVTVIKKDDLECIKTLCAVV